jgi:hypothetical protein
MGTDAGGRSSRRAGVLVVVATVIALAAACGSAGPSADPRRTVEAGSGDPRSRDPIATAIGGAWVKIADLPEADRFASPPWGGGYLAIGSRRGTSEGATAIWISPDGRTWADAPLATSIEPCYGGEPEASARLTGAWAGARGLMAIGWEQIGSDRVCPLERVVGWSSADGKAWTKQTDFGPGDLNGSPMAVWEAGDRWEAAIRDEADFLSIWSSAAGTRWPSMATIGRPGQEHVGPVAISRDGRTRLMAVRSGESDRERLIASADGRAWGEVRLPPLDASAESWSAVTAILAPSDAMPSWVVVERVDGSSRETVVWASADLESWQRGTFPTPMAGFVGSTAAGILAVAFDPCVETGECRVDPPAFLSRDGLRWVPVFEGPVPRTWIDGPAGLIGLRDGAVYALQATGGLGAE